MVVSLERYYSKKKELEISLSTNQFEDLVKTLKGIIDLTTAYDHFKQAGDFDQISSGQHYPFSFKVERYGSREIRVTFKYIRGPEILREDRQKPDNRQYLNLLDIANVLGIDLQKF